MELFKEILWWVTMSVWWGLVVVNVSRLIRMKAQLRILEKMEKMYDVYFAEMKIILKGVANEDNN